MPILPFLLAPLALLVPLGLAGVPAQKVAVDAGTAQHTEDRDAPLSALPLSDRAPGWQSVFEGAAPRKQSQVRIERRVILRISPAPGPIRQNLNAAPVQSPTRTRITERPAGKCIESASIGGVADRGDRLLMFLKDRRVFAAKLEKGCSPRDFYRGFYMENSEDGRLCIKRDRLMSRAGAKCQVDSFKELVVEQVD